MAEPQSSRGLSTRSRLTAGALLSSPTLPPLRLPKKSPLEEEAMHHWKSCLTSPMGSYFLGYFFSIKGCMAVHQRSMSWRIMGDG